MIDLEVSPGAQADAAAEEQLVDGHLTVPGGLEWDETSPKRHTIANLRYAGGKEHNVRYVSEVDYDAALAREALLKREMEIAAEQVCASEDREAALREDLTEVKRHVKNADMVFDLLRIACDATGETTALVYSKLGDMLNANAELEAALAREVALRGELATIRADRDAEKEMKAKAREQRDVQTISACELQQRLTVAEQRVETLTAFAQQIARQQGEPYFSKLAKAALKPAAEGEGS